MAKNQPRPARRQRVVKHTINHYHNLRKLRQLRGQWPQHWQAPSYDPMYFLLLREHVLQPYEQLTVTITAKIIILPGSHCAFAPFGSLVEKMEQRMMESIERTVDSNGLLSFRFSVEPDFPPIDGSDLPPTF